MSVQWYYVWRGAQKGPVSTSGLRQLARSGMLGPDDLVWREGLDDWKPARVVRNLFPEARIRVDAGKGAATASSSQVEAGHDIALGDESSPLAETASGDPAVPSVDRPKLTDALSDADTRLWIVLGSGTLAIGLFLLWLFGWYSLLSWALRISTAAIGLGLLGSLGIAFDRSEGKRERTAARLVGLWLLPPAMTLLYASTRDWRIEYAAIPAKYLHLTAATLEMSASEKDLPPQFAHLLRGHGSAFVFERTGSKLRLFTNAHCLQLEELITIATAMQKNHVNVAAYNLTVTFPSGKRRKVERISFVRGGRLDAAQLEVDANGLDERTDYLLVPHVDGIVKRLRVAPGDSVIAVGTPQSTELSATQSFGHVGSLRDKVEWYVGPWIQHDAKITGGNSGGPLFLSTGGKAYWIGINTLSYPDTQLHFALSADAVVGAEYVWADATPIGIANLIRDEYKIAATAVGRPPQPARSPSPPNQDYYSRLLDSRTSFFDRVKIGIIILAYVIWFIANEKKSQNPPAGATKFEGLTAEPNNDQGKTRDQAG